MESEKSDKLIKRLENIFNKRKIYLSDPNKFNDPFDCRANLTIHESILKRNHYIREMIRKYFPGKTRKEQESLIKEAKIKINEGDYQYQIYEESRKIFGVYCLSDKNDDLLMWSHYSEGHKGLCIEFDTSYDGLLFGTSMKVIYSDQYPTVNIMDIGNLKEFQKAFFTKSKHWEYEQEWRIFRMGHGEYSFEARELSGVILGALIHDDKKKIILDWISKYPTKINIYQANINNTRYQLDIKKV